MKNKLNSLFICKETLDKTLILKYNNLSKAITINPKDLFNEDYARLAGLMPDGSLIKDLMRIYFHQKKDLSKISLFASLISKLFSPKCSILYKPDPSSGMQCYINSQTLAQFFYHIIGIPKSDEQMRIPKWIFSSSKSIQLAYLREAFDMEGTVSKKLTEIRFGTKDKNFAQDINILLEKLNIKSHLTFAPRIKQISGQYRVSIYRKENFIKFKEIGFRIPFLKERFNNLLIKYNI